MEVDWSNLQSDLLESVARKLTIYADYIRIRAVCKKWRSVLLPKPHQLPCQLPWLMLRSGSRSETRRGFFNITENKVHRLKLPEAQRRRCCGSSQGWLVLVEHSPIILLLNPLTRTQFQLPPLTTFPNVLDFNIHKVGKEYLLRVSEGSQYTRNLNEMRILFIKKVILSSRPTSVTDNYIAVAILNETWELAFCKKGIESWTMIDDARSYCEDVIYYKSLFYAVNKKGSLAICDVNGISPLVTLMSPVLPFSVSNADVLYLVASSGELLLVTRYLDLEHDPLLEFASYKTVGFNVFQLDVSLIPKWVEVKNLGDQMLFLGTNSSLCLLASEFSGCQGNSIYFTNDYSEANDDGIHGNHDSGVFNMGDRSIEALPYCTTGYDWSFLPPPVWITPNPWYQN